MDLKVIQESISSLPPSLRSQIFSRIVSTIEEAKAFGKEEMDIEKEVIEVLLQELYQNLIEPIKMLGYLLESRPIKEKPNFKVEFSDIQFNPEFIEITQEFQNEYWSLVSKFGNVEKMYSKNNQLKWKEDSG